MALFDYFTGFDRENYEAGLEADRKRIALNAAQLARRRDEAEDEYDLIIADELQAAYAKNDYAGRGTGSGGPNALNPDAEIGQAFLDGLKDGRDGIRKTLGQIINEFLKNTLGLVPWQLWVAGIVVALWYLGWIPKLLNRAQAR